MSDRQKIVILGAGPAGLGAAYKLAARDDLEVLVLERNNHVGGNAGSFELAGLPVDFGSHRLHPASDPEVMADIQQLLGPDLLNPKRHGRIRLRGRWIHFPLKPVDLALRLPPTFALGVMGDGLGKIGRSLVKSSNGRESFASILEDGLGKTICRDFYFPYARKLWGHEPEALSAIQARRRVSAGSLGKLIGKVLRGGAAEPAIDKSRFFYPRAGFGQISAAYAAAAQAAGASLEQNATVACLQQQADKSFLVSYEQAGQTRQIRADKVWSTIPITTLATIMEPGPPAGYIEAAQSISYRAMILIYLVLDQDQFTEYDAHYFPESEIAISRLSEPKNYSQRREPAGRTVICAELPCSKQDDVWRQSDEALAELVCDSLAKAGIPVRAPVLKVTTRRLGQAYPIYLEGYETHFDQLDNWLSQVPNLLSFGRQGLFAHDNTHHALYMAYAAAECLETSGTFDAQRWQNYREEFKTHVVED